MRWTRRIAVAIAVLVALAGAGLWWLVDTQSGLDFVVARVVAASDGTVHIQASHGRLAGPLRLEGVAYDDPDGGTRARIARIELDPVVRALFHGELRLAMLAIDDATVTLPSENAPQQPAQKSSLSLQPPLAIILDDAKARHVTIRRDGKSVFVANAIDLAGAWTRSGLKIHRLSVQSPDGHASLVADVAPTRGYRGEGRATFAWRVDGNTWAGTLNANSNGRVAKLAVALEKPWKAQLGVDLEQARTLPWTMHLAMPPTDPEALLGDSAIKQLGLDLTGHGDRRGGSLQGAITLNQLHFQVQPLALDYDAAKQQVRLQQLVLSSPDIAGRLTGQGRIDLAGQPAQADLHLHWTAVQLPAKLVGQDLATSGDVTLKGGIDQYHVQGNVDAGPPGHLSHFQLDVTGTPDKIELARLSIQQAHGHLDTQGQLTLHPAIAWNLRINSRNFDPGKFAAGWNGALDMNLATRGQLEHDRADATLVVDKLEGKLRGRQLRGHGTLHLSPDLIVNGKLGLASGGSTVDVLAQGKQHNDIRLKLNVKSLADWLPGAKGSLAGNVTVTGNWPKLGTRGNLRANALAFQGVEAGTATIRFNIPDIRSPGGDLALDAGRLAAGGLTFRRVTLRGHGNAANHAIQLDANGRQVSLGMSVKGHLKGQDWTGTLASLRIKPAKLPSWSLQQPSRLTWSQGNASISQTCLTAGEPRMCVTAKRRAAGALTADFQIGKVPLKLITAALGKDLPIRSQGTIDGQGHIERSAAGALTGTVNVTSQQGRIRYADRAAAPLLAYRDLAINATLGPDTQHLTANVDLDKGGHLGADIRISGPQRALAGQVTMRLDSLRPVELFTTAVANVQGHVAGRVNLTGTVSAPGIQGRVQLEGFGAELPALGLKLHDGLVTLATRGPRQLRLDGHVDSGQGTLKLGGVLGFGSDGETQLAITGRNVEAADIPAAKVSVSPDLKVKRDAGGLHIGGSVAIDKADIHLEKLPGGGGSSVQPSPDVVVTDSKQKAASAPPLPVSADVTVNFGNHTHLAGYGMNGRISGALNVLQQPGQVTRGRGQIKVHGTYKAYGQDLTIKEGRLLFASTPIDDPGLDIRAIRKLNPNATVDTGQEVGLQISGTARHPVMTVFSNPVMGQSDALSYLITGKPLSAVSGGEGNMVSAAAQALGSAAGDLLAKGIGARLGIDAGVSNSAALGTAAFTVGKYLSPKLYISYGVGLFDPGEVVTLRYLLSRHWNFEAEQATSSSRASFNYRIEK